MKNINFNNKSNMQSIKNKKELNQSMQELFRIHSKKPLLNKERKDKERYFEKFNKAYPISSKQLPSALVLKKLSDDFLLSQIKILVQKERKFNIEILQHLQEIESRKIYLERGFSSLFDYAVRELCYGEGAAYRRIKAMKLCKDIPETKNQIESGQLNLSTASQLQSFFEKQKRKPKVKLKDQSTTVLSNTKSHAKNSVKQVLRDVSSLRRNSALSKKNCDLNLCFSKEKSSLKTPENANYDSDEIVQSNSFESLDQKKNLIKQTLGKSQEKTQKLLSEVDPEIFQKKEKTRFIGNKQVELKVILNEGCFKNLETLKNLLSHKNPRMSYGELINLLAELGLKKYDPSKKLKQKSARKQENQKVLFSANVLKAEQNKNICLDQNHFKKSLKKIEKSPKEPFVKLKKSMESKSINKFSTKTGYKQQNAGF